MFSVGGGDRARGYRPIWCRPWSWPGTKGPPIFGVVGRDGGFAAEVADACVVIPPLYPEHVTPLTEGLCAVIWHLLVSHPSLARTPTKWETLR